MRVADCIQKSRQIGHQEMIRIFLLLLLSIFLSSYAKAQSSAPQLLYSPTTPEYLAKSYWLLNELNIDDNENIDQYLMITECDLYEQYFANDIEWSKIRDATRGYIKLNKQNFPRRFEFVQPIYLDRYDTNSQTFVINQNSQIKGVLQIQVSGNSSMNYRCIDTSAYNPLLFPINAVLKLSRPLSYTSVQTKPEAAQEYLKYMEENDITSDFGRPAYIRYRFKVEQSLSPVRMNGGVFANFFGTLESVSIFGDQSLFIKLEEVKL